MVSLSRKIVDTFSDNHYRVLRSTARYVLQAISASQFHKELRELNPSNKEQVKNYRLYLKQSGYVIINYRAFLYLSICNRASPGLSRRMNIYATRYGITSADVHNTLCSMVLFDYVIINHISTVTINDTILRPKLIRSVLESLTPDIERHCTRFVLKKMRFIINSYNIAYTDLVSEIMIKAIEAYYWSLLYSTGRSTLHVLNFIRRACTNHGLNLITYYTTGKRARLVKSSDSSFNLVVVSQNQLSIESTIMDGIVTEDNDLRFSVAQIIDNHESNPKALIMLKILMGHTHTPFVRWLKSNKGIRHGEGDKLIEKVGAHDYILLISEYLGLPLSKTKQLISTFKKQLR